MGCAKTPNLIKERGRREMNLSALKWIKVITPVEPELVWAYTSKHIKKKAIEEPSNPIIDRNGLVIFPLHFKGEKAATKPSSGDLIVLTQHAKITHIVEVLEDKPHPQGKDWYTRYVKIIWWKPEKQWENLPHRDVILDCNLFIMDGMPHKFIAFDAFNKRWNDTEGIKVFQSHLTKELMKIDE